MASSCASVPRSLLLFFPCTLQLSSTHDNDDDDDDDDDGMHYDDHDDIFNSDKYDPNAQPMPSLCSAQGQAQG